MTMKKMEKLREVKKTLNNTINDLETRLFVESVNVKHRLKTTNTTKRN